MNPSYFAATINQYLPEPQASLLNGILYGLPLENTPLFFNQLKRTGISHLVVLSGMNIAILSNMIISITWRFGKRASIVIAIILIIFFIVFVGPEAPIVRAGFTTILTFVSYITGRRSMPLYTLFVSALCIGIFWPQWLTSISFQLSYAATTGLILFNKPMPDTPEKSGFIKSLGLYIKQELRTTMAAQLFTVPLIMLHFRQISLIAPVTNILVGWTAAPIMLFGIVLSITMKIHWSLGMIPAYICYGITTYIVITVNALSQIPFIFFEF